MNQPAPPLPSAEENPILTDLVEAFAARVQAGEALDAAAYAREHPAHEAELRRLLPAVVAMAELGESKAGDDVLAASAADADLPLQRLGDFQLLREVGRGGMGVVYQAEQVSLGRRVALKVLPTAAALDGRALQRFKNEAQAAALLQHPNIVPVIAVGCEHGMHFFAMQFIDGISLAGLIRDLRSRISPGDDTRPEGGPADPDRTTQFPEARPEEGSATAALSASGSGFSEAELGSGPPARSRSYFRAVARLALQAAEALEHAHQMGVIHRDVKPANLLVNNRGNVWVTDFGLARLRHDAGLTAPGDLVGTIRYMSPEQARADRVPIDHRTDVYALGATLYELLTLQPAFPGDDRRELLRRILLEEPRRPRRVNAAVPADLEAIVLKAMEKTPADRYASAQEMAEDLRRYLADEPVRARRSAPWRRAVKWAHRHAAVTLTAVAAAAVVLVTLAVAVTLLSVNNQQLREQENQLRQQTERLTQEQGARTEALRQANEQAARAQQAGQLVRDALKDVLLQLADRKLQKDPQWSATAEKLLQRGVKVYEDLARVQGKDPQARCDIAFALRQAAAVFAFLGQDASARQTWGRAIELGEGLVKVNPDYWPARFALAGAYRELGDQHRDMGRRPEALKAYQEALDVWTHPTPVQACPLEGSLAHDGLGNICEQSGQELEAAEHYHQAIAHREKFVALDPDNPEHRMCLCYWHRKLGWLVGRHGTAEQAGGHLRTAYDLSEKIVKDNKYDAVAARMELVQCCRARGDWVAQTEPEAAAKFYQQAQGILAELAQAAPGEPRFRQLLAEFHGRLGFLARIRQHSAKAAEHFRKARDLLVALAADVPGGGPGPGAPGANENALAWFLATCPDESFRDAGRAVAAALKAVGRAPLRGDYQGTLGAAYYRAEKYDHAIEALQKGRKLPQGGGAADLVFLALAYEKKGNHEQAQKWHRKALKAAQLDHAGDPALRVLRDEAAALLGASAS
jgi:serine/threonine protein kinase